MINPIVKTIELRDGRTITLETGKLAKQADGAVMLRMGNTMLSPGRVQRKILRVRTFSGRLYQT